MRYTDLLIQNAAIKHGNICKIEKVRYSWLDVPILHHFSLPLCPEMPKRYLYVVFFHFNCDASKTSEFCDVIDAAGTMGPFRPAPAVLSTTVPLPFHIYIYLYLHLYVYTFIGGNTPPLISLCLWAINCPCTPSGNVFTVHINIFTPLTFDGKVIQSGRSCRLSTMFPRYSITWVSFVSGTAHKSPVYYFPFHFAFPSEFTSG